MGYSPWGGKELDMTKRLTLKVWSNDLQQIIFFAEYRLSLT